MNGKEITFKSLAQQTAQIVLTQKYKWAFIYKVSAIVEASGSFPEILNIDNSADFLMEKITGTCAGPVDVEGIPQQSDTDFPMPGIAAGQGFAGRGLSVELIDSGNTNVELTKGNVPVETLISPGYGNQLYLPMPLKYFFARNANFKFNFTNQDTKARHSTTFVLIGWKYNMPMTQEALDPQGQVTRHAQIAV